MYGDDVKQTYCGKHFTIYTNIEPCYIPERNIMLYVNYTTIKKKKFSKKLRSF